MELPLASAQTAEPAEQLVLLAEIRDQLLLQNKQKKNQLLLLRICAGGLSLLALAVVIVCAVLVPKLSGTLAEVDSAVAMLDMEQVASLISNMDTVAAESMAMATDASVILSDISKVDFASFNVSLAELDTAVQKFSQLDIQTLNEAIRNLNDTVAPLATFLNRFR